ncbi:TPA: hypothetical protein P0E23_000735 [Vibrio harveyi]|nr:hypothetical protein [Vibrio harveyi]HDM8168148.1 hypothetical protein [Vibrio harveyi]
MDFFGERNIDLLKLRFLRYAVYSLLTELGWGAQVYIASIIAFSFFSMLLISNMIVSHYAKVSWSIKLCAVVIIILCFPFFSVFITETLLGSTFLLWCVYYKISRKNKKALFFFTLAVCTHPLFLVFAIVLIPNFAIKSSMRFWIGVISYYLLIFLFFILPQEYIYIELLSSIKRKLYNYLFSFDDDFLSLSRVFQVYLMSLIKVSLIYWVVVNIKKLDEFGEMIKPVLLLFLPISTISFINYVFLERFVYMGGLFAIIPFSYALVRFSNKKNIIMFTGLFFLFFFPFNLYFYRQFYLTTIDALIGNFYYELFPVEIYIQ